MGTKSLDALLRRMDARKARNQKKTVARQEAEEDAKRKQTERAFCDAAAEVLLVFKAKRETPGGFDARFGTYRGFANFSNLRLSLAGVCPRPGQGRRKGVGFPNDPGHDARMT